MNSKPILAIFAGLSLLLPVMSFNAFAAFEPILKAPSVNNLIEPNQGYTPGAGLTATSIELDMIEQCTNSLQCDAIVYTGTTVVFTGMLTDDSGVPLPEMEVTIMGLLPTPELVVLTSATTDFDGIFTAEWMAKHHQVEPAFTDVTRKFLKENLEVLATYAGDERFAQSKSGKLSMTVEANTVHSFMNSDKNLYDEGDTVLIFIAFIDSNDEFIDPDNISVTWNNEPIELEKKKVGSYTITIENLAKRHQQVVLVPEKEGFNATTSFLTLIVDGLR
ncbi:MAG: hypothetical protein ACE5KA_05790 [Nitrososphaerales archaeon]